MSGCMYQLRTNEHLPVGLCVLIGGPHDRFGQILREKDTNNRGTLYLIRGIGNTSNGHNNIYAPNWAPPPGDTI